MATQGCVQLIVKPLVVLGVIVMVGMEVLEMTATVSEEQHPFTVLQKVAV
jgi:hypothetical protein